MSAILQLDNVTKRFDGTEAIRAVSLEFDEGRVSSLIGPNGAGKTTLFHLIGGSLVPDSGTIFCCGNPINGLKPWQIAARGVGRLFQDVRVFGQLSAMDNLLVACPHSIGESLLANVVCRRRVGKQEREFRERSAHWLDFVGLGKCTETLGANLSYGQQKLLAIARLLAGDAKVLLLDEPTAGISPAMIDTLLGLIRNLADQGRTVVLIEHNMSVVLEVSHWVYFMDDGELAFMGLPQDVLGNSEVRAAYIGL